MKVYAGGLNKVNGCSAAVGFRLTGLGRILNEMRSTALGQCTGQNILVKIPLPLLVLHTSKCKTIGVFFYILIYNILPKITPI